MVVVGAALSCWPAPQDEARVQSPENERYMPSGQTQIRSVLEVGATRSTLPPVHGVQAVQLGGGSTASSLWNCPNAHALHVLSRTEDGDKDSSWPVPQRLRAVQSVRPDVGVNRPGPHGKQSRFVVGVAAAASYVPLRHVAAIGTHAVIVNAVSCDALNEPASQGWHSRSEEAVGWSASSEPGPQ